MTAPPCIFRIAAERQTSLASLEALPVTNLESFEATINPDRPVKNNIILCRVNNDTKEYWLAKATCSPWVTTADDNLEDIPYGTSVVQVGMRAAGGCGFGWCCAVCSMQNCRCKALPAAFSTYMR
jgi:hypothetical protein